MATYQFKMYFFLLYLAPLHQKMAVEVWSCGEELHHVDDHG